MSHIRYTERKLDYRYMPPMQCCPFYHYSILIRIGSPKHGFQRNVFSKFWLRKLLFSTSKIKVEWERKKPVKISVKGDNFFRWKNNLPSFHRILYICVLDPSLPILCIPQRSHCISSSIVFFVPSFWKIASTILRYGWKTHFMIWVTQRRKFQPNFLEKNKNKC